MANITLLGASYEDVPAVTLPQTGGGTVTFYENGGGGGGTEYIISPTTTFAGTTEYDLTSEGLTSADFVVSSSSTMYLEWTEAQAVTVWLDSNDDDDFQLTIQQGTKAYCTKVDNVTGHFAFGNGASQPYGFINLLVDINNVVSVISDGSPSNGSAVQTTGYGVRNNGGINTAVLKAELHIVKGGGSGGGGVIVPKTITANGTYYAGDDDADGYSPLTVNVAGEDTLVEALHNRVTSVSDDTLTSIRSYGLANMSALTSVDFPNLQTINTYSFYNDANLVMEGWQFPNAKTIGNYAFRYCYGMTGDVVLPSTVTSIGQYSFASCKNIETFTATGSITTFGTYTFTGASADHKMMVREIHLPNLGTSIALNLNFGSATAANACQYLELVDIGKAKSIAANTFANCYALQTLIMRRTSVTTCANVSAFLNTPIRGRNSMTADIYVPEALIDSYKAATNWKTIDGYGFVTWHAIEGSEYEL